MEITSGLEENQEVYVAQTTVTNTVKLPACQVKWEARQEEWAVAWKVDEAGEEIIIAEATAAAVSPVQNNEEEWNVAEPLIELKEIYKVYQMGEEEVRANDGVTMTIYRGEFVAIVGKSGSGKSTLMNIIGALDVPSDGTYLLGGEDVGSMTDNQLAQIRNKMIGFIFQQYNLLPN